MPAARREAIARLAAELRPGMQVALCTHINADGDGCGSESALARLLGQMGIRAIIVNPTPWPELFRWLLGDDVEERSAEGAKALAGVDRVIVLDISDLGRLGALADAVRQMPRDALVIDHHLPGQEPPGKTMLSDTAACATAELVYDFARERGLTISSAIAKSLYTALVTDTGGFRFGNTSPRCLAVAADLLTVGVDPEEMYHRIYGSVPLGRLHLLREALESLEVDSAHGIAWVRVAAGALERFGVSSEDLDGISEYPRSVRGVRLAMLFRDLGHGKVKVSFRSRAGVDVNALAREFGGGGHTRASGALVAGTLDAVTARVLEAARRHVELSPTL
ncbi:bifunctional oligoribonuclease/PAP phosphatase NrnA [Pseudogemmatithrix spongiicola]|uniref:Bifunctional oligoribonuclease/PAP phosphatase NrnA n=1 Tax=Pseudogemmatithrix spongiicola TaxID=3062599 RepID=A0AA49Q5I5_9BACT|nr:bifunctional oligoribonuclease/PAP phosphatase NrnA [Gemmatimonas sp.]WKW12957.1 bifunctional oligoribonuclease/PAP phosphatase NrnA [Gemmatimonadaceae bacterium 'strain 138']WKW15864.1 bifunctional oligoribonuclease/PAP phosphatase NrnA [Gemmatimonadaceae bacterium 'strain 318']